MIGKEPQAATAKRSGPGLGHSAPSSRLKSAPQCKEPSPRYPSWPAVIEPRKQAGYMTAPDPIADAAQNSLRTGGRPYMTAPEPDRRRRTKLLANRGPSIHDGRRRGEWR